jgi:hypothetical protein
MNTVERHHPVWTDAFSERTREEQRSDDAFAWGAVTGILLTIVSVGVCLAIFSVWCCI